MPLLAAGALLVPGAAAAPPDAARDVAADAPGDVGISAVCGGDAVEVGARRPVRDGGALKAAVLVAALAQDDRPDQAKAADPAYRRVLAEGDLAAANTLIARLGDGSTERGTVAVNGFLQRAGLTDSAIDGPYRQGGGPSRKRTSARDLRLMVQTVDRASRGAGRLVALGVDRGEARLVLGLMAATSGEGLLAGHVPGRLVHRTGRLADQRNDAALVVRPGGVRCHVGLAVTGADADAARAAGGAVMRDVVLPLAAADGRAAGTTTRPVGPQPPGTTTRTTGTETSAAPPAAPGGDGGDGGEGIALWLAGAAVLGLGLAAVGRQAQVTRRHRRRATRRPEAPRR